MSAALHLGGIAAALFLARDAVSAANPRAPRPLRFVTVIAAPDPALVEPIEPLRLPPLETPPAEPEPASAPAPEVVVARLEPTPVPPARQPKPIEREPIAAVAPPKPAPRVVAVGVFATNTAIGHSAEPVRSVQQAGFDAPAAHAPEIKAPRATVGAFEQSAAVARPQPGSDQPNVVSEAGFGTAMATASPRSASPAIADAGFGAAAGTAARRAPSPQTVQTTDFDARPQPASPAAASRPAPRIDVPVEVLSKPTPAYTDEARALKIEGDVVLEVEFAATGDLRVLRVVRGLGHGLDESASRAAQGMKFKPAQSAGRPIDFRTTVHIVFRLA